MKKNNLKWHKKKWIKKRKLKEKLLVEADIKYINKNIFIDLKTNKF